MPPVMRQVPRGRRGEITRHRVIDAAIEVFGMEGFERTSTRALVERAGANLVAIHYHFGGKEALYRAAAEHIAATLRERSEAALERGRALGENPNSSRNELIEGVCALFDDFAALALVGGVPECWRRFLIREQVEPTPTGAFELIFAAMRPFFDTIFILIGRLIDRPPDHSEVRLLATMIFGQVSVFSTHRAAALRLMGWRQLARAELRQIRTTARKYIFRLLDGAPRKRPHTARSPRRRPRKPLVRRGW